MVSVALGAFDGPRDWIFPPTIVRPIGCRFGEKYGRNCLRILSKSAQIATLDYDRNCHHLWVLVVNLGNLNWKLAGSDMQEVIGTAIAFALLSNGRLFGFTKNGFQNI